MTKHYTVKKTIRGNEYVAQFSGLTVALRSQDETYLEGTSTPSIEKGAQFLFDNVIVDPKGLTVEAFDSVAHLNDVLSFAREVMQGNLKPKEEKSEYPEKPADVIEF